MASFVKIQLDTTYPTARIFGPNQTTTATNTTLRIEGSETLSDIQDFYFIDALGVRHNVTLDFQGSIFEGNVSFNGFATGMATLYFQLYDEVYNKSPIYTYNVNVFESRNYRLEINLIPRTVIAKYKSRNKVEEENNPYFGKIKVKPRTELITTLKTLE